MIWLIVRTLKLRVKDKHARVLNELAFKVNFVWNYCNDLTYHTIRDRRKYLSTFDLNKYTSGSSKELGLNAQTIQMIGDEVVTRKKQFKKIKLKWRTNKGSGRSLGWIPFSNQSIKYKSGQIYYTGTYFSLWDSYGLSNYELRSGSFNEDSRGRWYINICVIPSKTETIKPKGKEAIGIDLGLKDLATLSNGIKIETPKFFRKNEEKLSKTQRANKKKNVRTIHAKIKNSRKDFAHKTTTNLVKQYSTIFVGNVKSSKLAKTKMSKSVLDAGWYQFKTLLMYKSHLAGVTYAEIDESFTTQTCSNCGALPDSRPRGITGLEIREWTCNECGTTHDRDVNAAKNILALGHQSLVEGAR